MKEEPEAEALPQTAQQQLAKLTATAEKMLEEAGNMGATDSSLKILNQLRALILANAEIELKIARTNALRTEKEVRASLADAELRLSVYETLLEGLETPERISDMRHSIGNEVTRMREAGIRSYERTTLQADED